MKYIKYIIEKPIKVLDLVKKIGVNRFRIHYYIRKGIIKASRIGKFYIVQPQEFSIIHYPPPRFNYKPTSINKLHTFYFPLGNEFFTITLPTNITKKESEKLCEFTYSITKALTFTDTLDLT